MIVFSISIFGISQDQTVLQKSYVLGDISKQTFMSESVIVDDLDSSHFVSYSLTRLNLSFGSPILWKLSLVHDQSDHSGVMDAIKNAFGDNTTSHATSDVTFETPSLLRYETLVIENNTQSLFVHFQTNFTESYDNLTYIQALLLENISNVSEDLFISQSVLAIPLNQTHMRVSIPTIKKNFTYLITNDSTVYADGLLSSLNPYTNSNSPSLSVSEPMPFDSPTEFENKSNTTFVGDAKTFFADGVGTYTFSASQGAFSYIYLDESQTVVFELANVTNQTTFVSIKLPYTLDTDIAYYFWKEVNGNQVKVPYQLSDDGKTLTIALKDGVVDNDGILNGRIVDPLAIPKAVTIASDVQVSISNNKATITQPTSIKSFESSAGEFSSVKLVDVASLPAETSAFAANQFPYNFSQFTITNLTVGETVTINLTYPSIPSNPQLVKFNSQTSEWYEFPFTQVNQTTLQIQITDGGFGDDDGVANGVIVDDIALSFIEIAQASHLGSNRNQLADIYAEVFELDDVWSPEITNGQYVRVTFERTLNSYNDITIFPRTVSGNPRIEIYEVDQNTPVAEFTSIIDNEYNKVFLRNLLGNQDTFDLRVFDGVIEFDHIIDPPLPSPNATCADGVCIVVFNQTGTYNWTVPAIANEVTVLVVAGGGASSERIAGGGGAGGLIYNDSYPVTPGSSIDIVVGAGGTAGASNTVKGTNGENSEFDSLIAIGGGAGGVTGNTNGNSGGSGGGARGNSGGATGGTATASQGNAGGNGFASRGGAGGGGANTSGQDGQSPAYHGGNGGDGLYYGDIFGNNTGENGWFAGGGAGGAGDGVGAATGGLGGGGDGGQTSAQDGESGMPATGGGGAGGGFTGGANANGGDGGSGVVIVRYSLPELNITIDKPDNNQVVNRFTPFTMNGTVDCIGANCDDVNVNYQFLTTSTPTATISEDTLADFSSFNTSQNISFDSGVITLEPLNTGVAWWNSQWGKRLAFNISNTAGNLTDFPVYLTFNTSTVGPGFDWTNDENAIRLVYYNGTENVLLEQYINTWDSGNENTSLWVTIPELLNNTNTTFYLYYQNTGATLYNQTSVCPGGVIDNECIDYFDDFDTDTSANYEMWDSNGASFTWNTGSSRVEGSNTNFDYFQTLTSSAYTPPSAHFIVEINATSNGDNDGMSAAIRNASGSLFSGVMTNDYDGSAAGGVESIVSWTSTPSGNFEGTRQVNFGEVVNPQTGTHVMGIEYDGSSLFGHVNNVRQSGSYAVGQLTVSGLGMGSHAASPGNYYNWLKIRRYVETTPVIASQGTEENFTVQPSGQYISSSLDLGSSNVDFTNLTLDVQIPASTNLEVSLRTSPDNSSWSAWFVESNNQVPQVVADRYVQYRLILNTSDNTKTPSLDLITLEYLSSALDWGNMAASGTLFTTTNPFGCGTMNAGDTCTSSRSVLPRSVGNYSLRLETYSNVSGVENVTSQTRNVSVFLQPQFASFTTSDSIVARGEDLTLTAQFVDDAAAGLQGYFVEFYDETANGSRQLIGNATTDSSGFATIVYTPAIDYTLGTHTLNVTYAGDGGQFILPTELTTTVTVTSRPQLADITLTPSSLSYGYNSTISVNVTDVQTITSVEVTLIGSENTYTYTMANTGGDIYEYTFNQTWNLDTYAVTINATNVDDFSTISSPQSLNVIANADFLYATEKDSYASNEVVYINGSQPGLDFQDWGVRIPIKISSNQPLTDYQFKISLDEIDFDFTRVQSDGADVRITWINQSSGDEVLIPHWTEFINQSSERGSIYTKIPVLNATEQTIYFYYDNPNATATDNGTGVFIFFDDFVNFTGWTQEGSGTFAQSSTRSFSGGFSGYKTASNDPNGGYKLFDTPLGRNITLEFSVNRNSAYTGGARDRIGLFNATAGGYGWAFTSTNGNLAVETRTSGMGGTDQATGSGTLATDQWVEASLTVTPTQVIAERVIQGIVDAQAIYTDATFTEFDRVYVAGGHDFWVDNMRVRQYTGASLSVTYEPSEVAGIGLRNNIDTPMRGYVRMLVQKENGVSWTNIIALLDLEFVDVAGLDSEDIITLWNNAGGWNTATNDPGTYRVYAILEDESRTTLKNSDGDDIVFGYNFTILQSVLKVSNVTHENQDSYALNEYETGDTIDYINVSVFTENNTAYDANVTLSILDNTLSSVGWGPNAEVKTCGDLAIGNFCENRWDNSTNGYPIPSDASAGTYDFFWDIDLQSSNGQTQSNQSESFIIHHLPANVTSVLGDTRISKPNSTTYTINITNPWSQPITNLNVTVNCPAIANFTCVESTSGNATAIIGSLAAYTTTSVTFNVTVNDTVPTGDYAINSTAVYVNPANEVKSRVGIGSETLEVRSIGILEIFIPAPTTQVTRGSSYALSAYFNNTGDTQANNTWLNYTLPSGWSVTSGSASKSDTSVAAGAIAYNNITALVGSAAGLGLKSIQLNSGADDGRVDFTSYTVTVSASTTTTATRDAYVVDKETYAYLNATLLYDNGTPISGQTISFNDTTSGLFIGTNTTNANGVARYAYFIPSNATLGVHTINASYAGNAAIYTLGSSGTTTIDVHQVPSISGVSVTPQLTGYGAEVNFSATISDSDDVDYAQITITYPNGTDVVSNMTFTPPFTYTYSFEETWAIGQYDVTILAADLLGSTNQTTTSFTINSSIINTVDVLNPSYVQNELVYLNNSQATSWWDTDWEYKREYVVENTNSELTDYQILIEDNISTAIADGLMNDTCADVRFTVRSNSSEVEATHFIVNCNDLPSEQFTAWVKVPTLIANANTTISMYYGNAAATTSTSDEEATFSYDTPQTVAYVVSDDVVANSFGLVSGIDGNDVIIDGFSYSLDKFDFGPLSVSAQNSTVQATNIIGVQGTGYSSADMIVPISWAGTEFYSGDPRATEVLCFVSPWGNATVDIYDGATLRSSTTIDGVGQCIASTITTSLRIESDIPVLAYHETTDSDGYPLYPATTSDLYVGSDSNQVEVAGGPSGASITCSGSTGASGGDTVAANNFITCSATTNNNYGSGEAVRVSTNNPVGIIQQADGDGGEATVGAPLSEMGTRFVVSEDADYIVAAAPFNNTFCALYTSGGQFANATSGTSTTGVTQVGFNIGSTAAYITGPWTLECDKPVWPYYQETTTNDETNMMTWAQMRQFTYPTPQVISSSTQLTQGSQSFNVLNLPTYGFLQLLVQYNNSGTWTTVDTIVNDATKRLIPTSNLDIATIFNATGWDTENNQDGTYRVLSQFTYPNGSILKNYDGSLVQGFDTFTIAPPAVELNISQIAIYDVSVSAPANRKFYINDFVDSGLNKTFSLANASDYRLEITVENIGDSVWDINTTNVTLGLLSATWGVSTSEIWYSNLSTIASRRTDTSNVGGTFDGTSTWNTSSTSLQLANGSSMTFFVILDVTQDGEYTADFTLLSNIFEVSDTSTYDINLVDNVAPSLFASTYAITPLNVTRGNPVTIYARWDEEIDQANATMSTTSSFIFSDKVNNSPQNSLNYTNFTYNTLSTWYLGVHTAQISVADAQGNVNNSLAFLNFTLWGNARISSSSLNTSTISVGESALMTCRVVDTTKSNSAIVNYVVTFQNSTHTLGTDTTNASGYATYVYTDSTPGTDQISCIIAENTTTYYKLGTPSQADITLTTTEQNPPTYSAVSGDAIVYKGNSANFNTLWNDDFLLADSDLATNVSGSFVNVSQISLSGTQDWANFSYAILSSVIPGTYAWYQTGTDSFGNTNVTPTQNFDVWGDADVVNALTTPSSMQTTNETIITCGVEDSLSGADIANYVVDFYYKLDSDPSYIYIGSNTTQAGSAQHNLTINSAGLYDVLCGISDNASLYYNASTNESTTTVNVVVGADFIPPKTVGATYQINDTTLLRGQCVQISAQWDESINASSMIYNNSPGSPITVPLSPPYTGNWTNQTLCTNNTFTPGDYSIKLTGTDQAGNTNATLSRFTFNMDGRSQVTYLSPSGITSRGVVQLQCSVTDVDTGAGISGYSVSFFDSDLGFTLGTASTNASGVAVYTYNYTTHPVGPDTITCTIASNPSKNYVATSTTDSGVINFYGTLSVNITAPLNDSILGRGTTIDLNATVVDENGAVPLNQFGATAALNDNWYDESSQIASGFETTWSIPLAYVGGYQDITFNVTESFYFSATDMITVRVFGSADVAVQTPLANTYYADAQTIDFMCNVTDSNDGSPIASYPVAFYDNMTLLTNGVTNASGQYTHSFSSSTLSSALHTLRCEIADNVSLLYTANTANATVDIIVDKVDPVVVYNSVTDTNGTYGRNWSYVSVNVTDDNIDSVILDWNGTTYSMTAGTSPEYFLNRTNLADGTYVFFVTVNDSASNSAQTFARNITVDTISPIVSIVSPIAQNYSVSSIDLNVTTNEITSTCQYSVNGGANVTLTQSSSTVYGDTVVFGAGTNTVVVYCNDTVNNIGQNTVVFDVDLTDPVATILYPVDATQYTLDNNIDFNFTATDNYAVATCRYSLDGAANVSLPGCANTTLLGLSNANHTLDLYVTDTAGRVSVDSIWFEINVSALTAAIVYPLDGETYSATNLEVAANTNKPATACSYRVDGGSFFAMTNFSALSWNATMASLSEATHTVDVNCTDGGPQANATQVSFTIDRTAPTATFVSPTPANATSVEIDEVYINLTLDEVADSVILQWENATGFYNYTMVAQDSLTYNYNLTNLENGLFNYTVYTSDAVGNFNWTALRQVTVATSAPVITIVSPLNNTEYFANLLELNATATKGIVDWWFELNGERFDDFTPAVTFAAQQGLNTLTVFGTDSIDLTGNASITFTVTTDEWNDTFETYTGLDESFGVQSNPLQLNGCWQVVEEGDTPQEKAQSCFTYRKEIDVTTAGTLSNHQVKINLNLSSEVATSKAQSDCSDLRFSYLNQVSGEDEKIPYWVESCNDLNNATVWINVPTIDASSVVHVYYGNNQSTTESNGYDVFEFFDNFDNITTSDWGSNAANWNIENGTAYPTTTLASSRLISSYTSPASYVTEMKVRANATSGYAGYHRFGNGAGTRYQTLFFDPVNNRISLNNGADNFYTINSSASQKYTIVSDFANNIYDVYLNDSTSAAISLGSATAGSAQNARFYSYSVQGLFLDYYAVRKYTSAAITVGTPASEATTLDNGTFTSIAVTKNATYSWGNFTVSDTIPSGTEITYALLNSSGNSVCGDISSAAANAVYDICVGADSYDSLTLFANLTTTNSNNPSIQSWSINSADNAAQANLTVNSIVFADSPVEGENVTVQVNVSNFGTSVDATNILVQLNISLYDASLTLVDVLNQTIDLTAGDSTIVNFTWLADIGLYEMKATVDANFTISEYNEADNEFTQDLSVSSWEIMYGDIENFNKVLFDVGNNGFTTWTLATPSGVAYYADADASWFPFDLVAFSQANDFNESDANLSMTYYNDSIQKLFDANNDGLADQTRVISIAGSDITVPVTNTTNSSNFVTGILYDGADGTPYDGTQDLVFVTVIAGGTTGFYGTYDYEVRVPSNLALQSGVLNQVTRLDQLD